VALKTNEKRALDEVKAILRERYGAVDIRLYGSKARGTDAPDSDVDLLVVLPETTRELESKIDADIFEINLDHDCLISAVYFSEVELRIGPMDQSPLYRRAIAEGVQL